eukprot:10975901-Alexandrium_andersonii.AAC.1
MGGWSAWAGGAAQQTPDPLRPLGGGQLGPGLGQFDVGPGPTARVQRRPTDVVLHLRGPGPWGAAPGLPPLE